MIKIRYPNGVIPHNKPIGMTYSKWYSAYENQLSEMYRIFCDIISQQNPSLVPCLENKNTFFAFSQMVYKSSSKYITPY
jgi:hypothetical protein